METKRIELSKGYLELKSEMSALDQKEVMRLTVKKDVDMIEANDSVIKLLTVKGGFEGEEFTRENFNQKILEEITGKEYMLLIQEMNQIVNPDSEEEKKTTRKSKDEPKE